MVAENLLLRHQLAVLTRPTRRRPRLRGRARLLWVLARRLRRDWRRQLVVVVAVRRKRLVLAWTLLWTFLRSGQPFSVSRGAVASTPRQAQTVSPREAYTYRSSA